MSGKRETIGRGQTIEARQRHLLHLAAFATLRICECNFLVNIIGNNGKNCPARKQAQTMATAGEEEGVGGCCNNCLKCVSELNIPWSAVVHRRMRQLK